MVQMIWDMSPYCESISWEDLIDDGLELGYSATLLALGVQVHTGKRRLKAIKHFGDELRGYDSVLARGIQAVALARLGRLKLQNVMHDAWPDGGPRPARR